tara:strand:+ start:101 stop:748 length:648 start_codon:yes stop_codon:yes gene_type:complete
MLNKKNLLIIVPALNEDKTIKKIIIKLKKFGHVLVVDDGSNDKTKYISKKIGAKVLSHKKNLGYNQALNSGYRYFLKKKYRNVITIDADNQLPAHYIKKFIKKLNEGTNIVCGVRHRVNRLGEKFFIFFSNLIWGLKDPLCGLKGFSYDFIKKNYSKPKFDSINTELIIKGRRTRSIKHLEIKNKSRKDTSRFGDGFLVNINIILTFFKCLIFIK